MDQVREVGDVEIDVEATGVEVNEKKDVHSKARSADMPALQKTQTYQGAKMTAAVKPTTDPPMSMSISNPLNASSVVKKGSGEMNDKTDFHIILRRDREWDADWTTKKCPSCDIVFTTLHRRHHCRKCGHIFCGQCSLHSLQTHDIRGKLVSVRVCNSCFEECNKQVKVSNQHEFGDDSDSVDSSDSSDSEAENSSTQVRQKKKILFGSGSKRRFAHDVPLKMKLKECCQAESIVLLSLTANLGILHFYIFWVFTGYMQNDSDPITYVFALWTVLFEFLTIWYIYKLLSLFKKPKSIRKMQSLASGMSTKTKKSKLEGTCIMKIWNMKRNFNLNGKYFLVKLYIFEAMEHVNQTINVLTIYYCALPIALVFMFIILMLLEMMVSKKR